jgi:hypothetical protein
MLYEGGSRVWSQGAKGGSFKGFGGQRRAALPAPLPDPLTESGTAMKEQELGEPITIREVAKLIGCSPWTVRQRHMRSGLPHFRAGVNGKLIFYRDQVVRWIRSQQKGGKPK